MTEDIKSRTSSMHPERENNPLTLPFDPEAASTSDLVRFGQRYRNDEPRLARVMQELLNRDTTGYREKVRALHLRWQFLVRYGQPARWPSDTAMEKNSQKALSGRCYDCGANGMLEFFGYHVGSTKGLRESQRQRVLDYIYRGALPIVNSPQYTRRWGHPESGQRLKELVACIAGLAQKAIWRRNDSFQQAIDEWERDLAYLKRTYYRPEERPDHVWEWPDLRFWLTDYISRKDHPVF